MCDTKKCTKCGRELPLDQFYTYKLKDGNIRHQAECKDCFRIRCGKYYQNNKEKCLVSGAEWRRNNSDKKKKIDADWARRNPKKVNAASAKWRKNNPEKARAAIRRCYSNPEYKIIKAKRIKERKAIDPSFKLIRNTRSAMAAALRGLTKSAHTEELVGCSIECLRHHLEAQLSDGMNWGNYGKNGWHVDHIIPLSYFDYSDPEQQKRAWHYTNLRPMWAFDNISKGNKIIEIQLVLI